MSQAAVRAFRLVYEQQQTARRHAGGALPQAEEERFVAQLQHHWNDMTPEEQNAVEKHAMNDYLIHEAGEEEKAEPTWWCLVFKEGDKVLGGLVVGGLIVDAGNLVAGLVSQIPFPIDTKKLVLEGRPFGPGKPDPALCDRYLRPDEIPPGEPPNSPEAS